jgi:hypothetical protein
MDKRTKKKVNYLKPAPIFEACKKNFTFFFVLLSKMETPRMDTTHELCIAELQLKICSYELFIREHGFHYLPLVDYVAYGEYYEYWAEQEPPSPRHCAPAA